MPRDFSSSSCAATLAVGFVAVGDQHDRGPDSPPAASRRQGPAPSPRSEPSRATRELIVSKGKVCRGGNSTAASRPKTTSPASSFSGFFVDRLHDPRERLVAHLLAHRIRDIERIDHRERVRFPHRARFRQQRDKKRRHRESSQQRGQGSSTRETRSTCLMHPPKPRQQQSQPESSGTREADDSADFESQHANRKNDQKNDQREGRSPSHPLTSRRHDLPEEVVGERKEIHAESEYCRTRTPRDKQSNPAVSVSLEPGREKLLYDFDHLRRTGIAGGIVTDRPRL